MANDISKLSVSQLKILLKMNKLQVAIIKRLVETWRGLSNAFEKTESNRLNRIAAGFIKHYDKASTCLEQMPGKSVDAIEILGDQMDEHLDLGNAYIDEIIKIFIETFEAFKEDMDEIKSNR